MFDFVQEKKRVVQIVLFLIIITFGFFGVDSYRKSGGEDTPATVNGEKITQQDFANALQQQQERVREQAGANFDPALFEKPEIKRMILDSLVNQRLLSSQARSAGLTLSDDQLAQVIAGVESFQTDGKFDKRKYEEVLRAQSLSPMMFEARVRDELGTRELIYVLHNIFEFQLHRRQSAIAKLQPRKSNIQLWRALVF